MKTMDNKWKHPNDRDVRTITDFKPTSKNASHTMINTIDADMKKTKTKTKSHKVNKVSANKWKI